jgi:peptidyl-dipeptidase Dcp
MQKNSTVETSGYRTLTQWSGRHGLPDFQAIRDDDFAPAFDAALVAHDAEIHAIAERGDEATFDNTVTALERSGDALSRVAGLFFNRASAETNEVIQALEREIAPKLSRHQSGIAMNRALFARIDHLYARRATLGLSREQGRVLERHWKGFVRAGARLDAKRQERLAAINEELASLGARFGQNVLADEKAWSMTLREEADLAGLPDFLRDAMAGAAAERGEEDAYAVTLSRSIIEPFLTFSERRDLRETAYRAWTTAASSPT